MNTITYTKIRHYLTCPRKYKLAFIDNLQTATTEPMEAGTELHRIIALMLTTNMSIEQLKETYTQFLLQNPNIQKEKIPIYRGAGFKYIDTYYNEQWQVVAVEQKLVFYDIEGIVDAIVVDEFGNTMLMEHKLLSGNMLPHEMFNTIQPVLYTFLAYKNGFDVKGIIYNIIVKSKMRKIPEDLEIATQKAYEQTNIYRQIVSIDNVEEKMKEIYDVVDMIRKDNAFVKNPYSCTIRGICPYYDYCYGTTLTSESEVSECEVGFENP